MPNYPGGKSLPALEALHRDARHWLASHYGMLCGFDQPTEPRTLAEIAAGLVASHPWDGVIPDRDRPDPVDDPDERLRRLLAAFRDMRALSYGDSDNAILAAELVAKYDSEASVLVHLAELDRSLEEVDAAALRAVLSGMFRALARFLVERSGGLLEEAEALGHGSTTVAELLSDVFDERVAELGLRPGAFARDEHRALADYPTMPAGCCVQAAETLAAAYPELIVVRGELIGVARADGEVLRILHVWNSRADGAIVDACLPDILTSSSLLDLVYLPAPDLWVDR